MPVDVLRGERGSLVRHRRTGVALVIGMILVAAYSSGNETTASTSTTTTEPPPSSATTSVPWSTSPTGVEDALDAADGLFAPSVLRSATVGLDPFAIRGEPEAMFAEVDPTRLLADIRLLSQPRGTDDPDGLEAAAQVVEDGFVDAGFRVRRYPGEAEGSATPTPALSVEIPGEDCPGRTVLLLAPYDAPAGSPGAEAASATAALLELSRVLAEHPLPMSVTLLAVPFGAEDPPADDKMELIAEGLELEPIAVYALDRMGLAAPGADDDNLLGLPPAYLLLVGDDGSEYLARTTTLSTARSLSGFWAFPAVADLQTFPEFDDRITSWWWDQGVEALLVTDAGSRTDERVGTVDDKPRTIDEDFLANGVRTVIAGLVGVGTLDADDDGEPDVCQHDW